MARLDISVLGPIVVSVNGEAAAVGGARQREVLAVLVARAGRAVSTDVLIDRLWAENPPRTARNSIQVFVSNIRSALGEEAGRLETVESGYRLQLDVGSLDAARFEAMVLEARTGDEPVRRAEMLADALQLWRGHAFEGIENETVQAEVARLHELRAAAQEARAEALLSAGRHDEAIPELEGMVLETPLREGRWAQLMLALYRSGRQAEALRAFQRARTVLAQELGIEPSTELARLEEQILTQDPGLASAAQPAPAADVSDASNPYKGLEAFTTADAGVFFGREALATKLVGRLKVPGLTALVGPSGSGKSSVVRAGLIPAIARGDLAGSERWPIVVMHPGTHPLEELALAAGVRAPVEPTDVGAPNVVSFLTERARERNGLLVVVDQLEELFVLASDDAAGQFIDVLVELTAVARVVVTLRADFYDRPLAHPDLARLLADGLETVVPLSAGELERAITRPAAAAGVHFDPPLLAEIIHDVGQQPASLPLLQYALTMLYEHRSTDLITLDDYDAIGGVAGALTTQAEQVWRELDDHGRSLARQLLLRLVAIGEAGSITRRPLALSELDAMAPPAEVDSVVDSLVNNRLVSIDRDPQTSGPLLEIAHEALLTEWTRLRSWVDETADHLHTHRRVGLAAADWHGAERDRNFLLTGTRLDRIDVWEAEADLAISKLEREYIDASRRRRDAEAREEQERRNRELALEQRSVLRLRLLVGVMAIAVVVAGALTVFALLQQREADRRTAQLSVQAISTTAIAEASVDPELSLLLAIEAGRASLESLGELLPIAEQALHVALDAPRPSAVLPGGTAVDIAPNGETVAVGHRDGLIGLFDSVTSASILELAGHVDAITAVSFSPDGTLIASASWDGTVRLWDGETGFFLDSLSHDGSVSDLAWSDAGNRLLVGASSAAVIWDVDSRERLSVANVSSDGRSGIVGGWLSDELAVVASSSTVKLWDTTGQMIVAETDAGGGEICGLAVDATGPTVHVGDLLGEIFTFSIIERGDGSYEIEQLRRSVAHDGASCGLDVGSGGLWAHGGGDGEVALVGRDGNEILSVLHGGDVLDVAISSESVASTAPGETGRTLIWNVFGSRPGELATVEVDTSLNGSVAVREGTVSVGGTDGRIAISATAPSPPRRAELGEAAAFAVGPRGLVATSDGATLVTVEHEAGEPYELLGLTDLVLALDFDADGTRLVGVDWRGKVVVWDLEQREILAEYQTGVEGFRPPLAAVDPGADRFAVVDDGRTLTIRSLRDVAEVTSFDVASSGRPDGLALHGRLAAVMSDTAGETVLWDIDRGEAIARFPTRSVTEMAFVPGRDRLLTGSADGTVSVWDTANGVELFAFPRGEQIISSIEVASDGSVAAIGDISGNLRVLVLDPELLIDTAEDATRRSLTVAECRAYLALAACP